MTDLQLSEWTKLPHSPIPEDTPLAWARRLTPLGIGRRRVQLDVTDGVVTLTQVSYAWGRRKRVVAQGPAREWHSVRLSRSGRGVHVWHRHRLFRLVGYDEQGFFDAGDLGPLAVVLVPYMVYALMRAHRDRVREDREKSRTVLERLAPIAGPPPPGVRVCPPWPGWVLMIGRNTVRLAVLAAVLAGAYAWFAHS